MSTPDGVGCRHCGKPIYWDEICWVHEHGLADCYVEITGGTPIPGVGLMNPKITRTSNARSYAEPEGEWS